MFHFIKKGCHPKPMDFHSTIFQDGHIAPPTRINGKIHHFFLMAKSINPLFQWPFSSSRTVNVLPGRVKYPASEHLLGFGASGNQAVAAVDDGAASPSRGERQIFGGSYMILVHCMVKITLSSKEV